MKNSSQTSLMPSLFVGHGSPMNILASNDYTRAMRDLGKNLLGQGLTGIVCISAHWHHHENQFENQPNQPLVYDFYGFPKPLYEVKYPAKGLNDEKTKWLNDLNLDSAHFSKSRGIDHGVWAVLVHLFPEANVEVTQLAIKQGLSYAEYFKLGQFLAPLREKGILILASGNLVHNLRQIEWQESAKPKPWALEFDHLVAELIAREEYEKLCRIQIDHPELFQLAHPTDDHFIPLFYALGAGFPAFPNPNPKPKTPRVSFPCSFIQNSSISMRSVLIN